MKQLFAFLTALSLFFAFPFYVFAEQNSVDTIFYDDNIDVVTPDSFNQLFIEETTTNAASHHSTEELDPNTIYTLQSQIYYTTSPSTTRTHIITLL